MPVRILLVLLLVNFSAFSLAQATATQIRGPKSADNAFVQQQFGPLTANDTLWRIAEQVKPNDSVTTYQVMYAIFLKNPEAFNDANFNHLRPGAIMLLPDLREIRSVDPQQAKRKAELDDQSWAERQQQERLARERAREQASRPSAVNEQTQAELLALREQHQGSLQLLDGVVRENEQLRGTLTQVQQQLELLQQQLAADQALQQELNQLVLQQQAMLAEQEARRQAEEAAKLAEPSSSFADLMRNPLVMLLAASIPAILALAGVLFWLRRRTRKTEEVVAAATKEPTPAAGYQSPVPPLDNSQDFDDSLFTLDDSLLDEAFEQPVKNMSSQAKVQDDDQLPDFSEDILLDELDGEDPLKTELLDMAQDEQDNLSLDNLDTDLTAAIEVDSDEINLDSLEEISFDAENILSDTDLAALLGGDDSETNTIELTDPTEEQAAAKAMIAEADHQISLTDQDDIDSLLEEIEIDLPADDPESVAAQSEAEAIIDDSWADDLEAATEGQFEGAELDAFAEELASATPPDNMNPELDNSSFVNLLQTEDSDDSPSEDEALLQDELDDILQQASSQGMVSSAAEELLQGEPEPELKTEPEEQLTPLSNSATEDVQADEWLTAALQEPKSEASEAEEALLAELLAETGAEHEELVADPAMTAQATLTESAVENTPGFERDPELDKPPQTADSIAEQETETFTEEVVAEAEPEAGLEAELDAELDADLEVELEVELEAEPAAEEEAEPEVAAEPDTAEDITDESQGLLMDSLNLADESAFVATLLDSSESEAEQAIPELDLDLSLEDDKSVQAQTEASLAVENPSALLDDYPELDLVDFELDTDDVQTELDQQLAELSDAGNQAAATSLEDLSTDEFDLDELAQQPFDQLLHELEQDTTSETAEPLAEPLQTPQENESVDLASEQAAEEQLPLLSDADFVEIDNLLSALEHGDADASRFEHLNVDVGLDEFADIIGEHTKMDVDLEDNGYAAKLDLVKAYIEMDEPESASLLINEILQSDAPEHVKSEAEQLKP